MISSVRIIHIDSTVCINKYVIFVTATYSDLMKTWQSKKMRTSSCMLWAFGCLVVSLHCFSHSGFGVERFMRINDENAITYPSTNVNHCIGLFLTFCKTVSKSTNQNDLILLVAFIKAAKSCWKFLKKTWFFRGQIALGFLLVKATDYVSYLITQKVGPWRMMMRMTRIQRYLITFWIVLRAVEVTSWLLHHWWHRNPERRQQPVHEV